MPTIESLSATVDRVPLRTGFRFAKAHLHYLDHVEVLLTDSDGRVGRGEATVLPQLMGETAAGITAALELFEQAVKGLPVGDVRVLHARMDAELVGNQSAKAAVDFAVHDLLGAALETPVHQLLGATTVRPLPTVWVAGIADIASTLDELHARYAEGYRHFKVKIGVDDEADVRRVRAVRDALDGDARIRVDGNQAYTASRAVRVLAQLDDLDLELVEQPCHHMDLAGMAVVRRCIRTPLMADEAVWTPTDAYRVLEAGAADIIYLKPARVGGLFRAQEIAAIAAAASTPCAVGGNLELETGTLANVHLATALAPPYAIDGDMGLRLHHLPAPLTSLTSLRVEPGLVEITDRPGLGHASAAA